MNVGVDIRIVISLINFFIAYKCYSSSKYLQAINNGQVDHVGPYMGIPKNSEKINQWPNVKKD
jgi:hypothetical protein